MDARLQFEWDRAAYLAACIRVSAFGNKKRWDPRKLNPYRGLRHRKRKQTAEDMLRDVESFFAGVGSQN